MGACTLHRSKDTSTLNVLRWFCTFRITFHEFARNQSSVIDVINTTALSRQVIKNTTLPSRNPIRLSSQQHKQIDDDTPTSDV